MPALNDRWQGPLGEPRAWASASTRGSPASATRARGEKFKYGPLGDTVNVASRVQGASKYFKSSLLITRATRDRLGPEFQSGGWAAPASSTSPTRSSCSSSVRLTSPKLASAVPPMRKPCWRSRQASFASPPGSWAGSSTNPDDGPSFALLARAIAYFVEEPETFDPAFRLPGK